MEASFFNQIFTALFILLSVSSSLVHAATKSPETCTQFIKTSCSSTTYPRLCFTSLSIHANLIQTSPENLAKTALNVSLSSAKSTTYMMLKFSRSQGMNPREVSAMKDCLEELNDSVDELKSSLAEMRKLKGGVKYIDFGLIMSNIQTWVSAALTDENTCTDGFVGKSMNGNVKVIVRDRIVNVAQLTSNALALVNRLSDVHA